MTTSNDPRSLFTVHFDEATGVVRFAWLTGVIAGEAEARSSTDAIEVLGLGAVPLLVDLRPMKKIDRAAREHYKTNKGGASAMAFLVDSPVTKMLANFFMATDSDTTPTRMFTDEGAAIAWLCDQK